MPVDDAALRRAVSSLLSAVGEDPNREGLLETPRRVAEMYRELLSGADEDPGEALSPVFDEGGGDLVLLKDIPFSSVCEHHLLPFFGSADVGYVSSGPVVGISKIARLLDVLSRRLQVQERLTDQLVDAMMGNRELRPEGVSAILSAEHLCITLRGARKPGSRVVTQASRGTLKTEADAERRFLALRSEG